MPCVGRWSVLFSAWFSASSPWHSCPFTSRTRRVALLRPVLPSSWATSSSPARPFHSARRSRAKWKVLAGDDDVAQLDGRTGLNRATRSVRDVNGHECHGDDAENHAENKTDHRPTHGMPLIRYRLLNENQSPVSILALSGEGVIKAITVTG